MRVLEIILEFLRLKDYYYLKGTNNRFFFNKNESYTTHITLRGTLFIRLKISIMQKLTPNTTRIPWNPDTKGVAFIVKNRSVNDFEITSHPRFGIT